MNYLLQDVGFESDQCAIRFSNDQLALEFDAKDGRWLSLRSVPLRIELLDATSAVLPADFLLEGVAMIERVGATFERHAIGVSPDGKRVELSLVFRVRPASLISDGEDYEFVAEYALRPHSGQLERSARLTKLSGSDAAVKLDGFRLAFPGISLGDLDDCRISAPGPWFPHNYVKSESPYRDFLERSVGFHGAPDGGFGVLALSSEPLNAALACWMDAKGETNYSPSIRGDGRRISFIFDDHRYARLVPRLSVGSDTSLLSFVQGDLSVALREHRRWMEAAIPLDLESPDWPQEMTLLEAFPNYFPGGFKEIAERLPFYREIGFNALYLMPHWSGGYSPLDLYQVNPEFGTGDDLKEMVRAAHRLGMRVLFDMVIHGFNEASPIPNERPELFIKDEAGKIIRHPAWGSLSTDWASEAYPRYMEELVLHDLREYDIDGYRVDAASFKGPNWDPAIPYPAYQSGSHSPQLMKRLIRAMRREKPDAVLLSEVFGPAFYGVSNLVHDNQTEAVQQFLEKMESGEATISDYKAHLANVRDLLPDGALRVFFARNHDTSWFYHFNGYSPRFLAMDAIHALLAIPEAFAGDPNHGPNPDDEPATWDYYRKLFAFKRSRAEFSRGRTLLREISIDDPNVFAALRADDAHASLVAISFRDVATEARITLSGEAARLLNDTETEQEMIDVITGQAIPARVSEEEDSVVIDVIIEPFQVLTLNRDLVGG